MRTEDFEVNRFTFAVAPTREFVAFSRLCIDASSRTECISFPREHVLHYQVCFAFSRECVAFKAS